MYLEALLFHIDDRTETIVNIETGSASFRPDECVKLNTAINILFEHHGDEVYKCGIKYFYTSMGIITSCAYAWEPS